MLEIGLGGKQTASVTAGICLFFTRPLTSTSFLDESVLGAVMVACRPNLDEIRNIKERGPSPIMNIALYHSMLSDILGGESSAQEKRREEKRREVGCLAMKIKGWCVYVAYESTEVYGTGSWARGSLHLFEDSEFEFLDKKGGYTSRNQAHLFDT